MYGKLFASMYDGTLYGNWRALVTFQQMVILADRTGIVDMTPQAMAARTSIPLKVIQAGLAVLEAPDEYSRSPEAAGRRIERLEEGRPWGWRIVNYLHYRELASADEKRIKDRERIAEKRRNATPRDMSQPVAVVAHADADADADADAEGIKTGGGGADAPARPRKRQESARRIPEDFSLTAERRAFAEAEKLDADRTFANFVDYWRSASGANARKHDWDAAWRKWCRKEADGKPGVSRGTRGGLTPDAETWTPEELRDAV